MKKFKYSDSDYDYTESMKPITFEEVRNRIVESLQDWEFGEDENDNRDINDPKVQSDIDQLAKRIMDSFWDQLMYIDENHEDDFEKIAMGDFD